MRLFSTILSALSLVLLVFVAFLYVRSYLRYEGVLHFSEGKTAVTTASGNGHTVEQEVVGHSTGLLSFRGHVTYVSMANPVRPGPWESWSMPADAPPAIGPMMLVWEARDHTGLAWGSVKTQNELRDPHMGIGWRLPYQFFTMPYWALTLLLAILPFRWITAYRRAARWEKEGRCTTCGKDLRGVSGHCPDCGEAIG